MPRFNPMKIAIKIDLGLSIISGMVMSLLGFLLFITWLELSAQFENWKTLTIPGIALMMLGAGCLLLLQRTVLAFFFRKELGTSAAIYLRALAHLVCATGLILALYTSMKIAMQA